MTAEPLNYSRKRDRGVARPVATNLVPCERCGLFVPEGQTCRCDVEAVPAPLPQQRSKEIG